MATYTSQVQTGPRFINFKMIYELLIGYAFYVYISHHNVHVCERQPVKLRSLLNLLKVSKGAKIRSRYNQVLHPTQDTNVKVTNSQLDTTNKSQEVSPFPAGDHKAHINRRAQRHSKHRTEQNIKDPQKKYRLGTVS